MWFHGQMSVVTSHSQRLVKFTSRVMVHGQSHSSSDACGSMARCQVSILIVRDWSGLLNALQCAITQGGTGAIIARRSALSVVNGQSEDMLQYIAICNHV